MAYYPLPENHSCSDNESIPVDNSSLLQFVTSPKNGSVANETTDVVCSSADDDNIPRPNTALMSLILTLTTFLLALALKEFRNSHFLGRNVSVVCTVYRVGFLAQLAEYNQSVGVFVY